MHNQPPDHYATLGLHQACTPEQIRSAYRILVKHCHPDINPASPDSAFRMQEINLAYETLGDPDTRAAYDAARSAASRVGTTARTKGPARSSRNINQDVHLRLEEFFRGAELDVRINDPSNPAGPETYRLQVPPGTAPGARFRLLREHSSVGGTVIVRCRVLPHPRFKARGSDLRCDLRIPFTRAVQGGYEMLRGATGNNLRVNIPKGVARGEVIRVSGEGLPNPRGGRGDLLVRIVYRPQVKITRTAR